MQATPDHPSSVDAPRMSRDPSAPVVSQHTATTSKETSRDASIPAKRRRMDDLDRPKRSYHFKTEREKDPHSFVLDVNTPAPSNYLSAYPPAWPAQPYPHAYPPPGMPLQFGHTLAYPAYTPPPPPMPQPYGMHAYAHAPYPLPLPSPAGSMYPSHTCFHQAPQHVCEHHPYPYPVHEPNPPHHMYPHPLSAPPQYTYPPPPPLSRARTPISPLWPAPSRTGSPSSLHDQRTPSTYQKCPFDSDSLGPSSSSDRVFPSPIPMLAATQMLLQPTTKEIDVIPNPNNDKRVTTPPSPIIDHSNADGSQCVAGNSAQTVSPKDLTSWEGVNFHPKSDVVEWATGYKTRLPYVDDKDKEGKNRLEEDEDHLRLLAATAIPATECPFVVYLQHKDFSSDKALASRIDQELTYGRPVVLQGVPYTPIEMTTESISENLAIPVNRKFDALDAAVRGYDPGLSHVRMSLTRFCEDVNNIDNIRCIHDCPLIEPYAPSFMKHLDQGFTAWPHLHTRFPDRVGVAQGPPKMRSWALFHQPLYHTYAHHDVAGTGTWTQVMSGYKFWVFLRGEGYESSPNRKRFHEVREVYTFAEHCQGHFYGSESDRYVVFARPGDIIIQPPSTIHEVYTPTPSVTVGGHFYTYNSLHLTECARIYDLHTRSVLTNQYHNSVMETMAMMMAALPLFPDLAIRKKPLAALCKMVANSSAYRAGNKTKGEVMPLQNKKSHKKKKDDKKPEKMGPEVRKYSLFALARHMAVRLCRDANLPAKTLFYEPLNATEEPCEDMADFIFSGDTWMDPLDVVDIANVNAYYLQGFS